MWPQPPGPDAAVSSSRRRHPDHAGSTSPPPFQRHLAHTMITERDLLMDPLHLRSAGTSLVISFSSGEAEVIHWGADLGSELPDLSILTEAIPHSAIDATVPAGLLPQASSSWRGRPALRGHRIADGVSGLDVSVRMHT